MNHLLQYLGVWLLALIAKILPVETSSWLAQRTGDLIFFVLKKRRRIALENVERAFGSSLPRGKKEAIVRSAFQSASLSMMELFIVEKIKKEASQRFTMVGNEHLEEAFSKKKGVVLVISHLGSWEYLSFLPFFTHRPWSVIVKDIKNPYLDKAINQMRRMMTVTPVEKSSSIRTILQQLKEGHGVALLIDQWAGDEGLWVDFFDEETSTTSIPGRLAEKTGCALVPAYCLRTSPGHYKIHLEEAIEVDLLQPGWERVITQRLNAVLEKQIRAHPEQWLWGHRRWKEKPDTLRRNGPV